MVTWWEFLEKNDLWLLGYIFVPFNQMNLRQNVYQVIVSNHLFCPIFFLRFNVFKWVLLKYLFQVTKVQSLLSVTQVSCWAILPLKIYVRWFSTTISHPVENPKFSLWIFRNCRGFYYSLVTFASNFQLPVNSLYFVSVTLPFPFSWWFLFTVLLSSQYKYTPSNSYKAALRDRNLLVKNE